jgi:hypothetical protein
MDMNNNQLRIEDILESLKNQIGNQAQQIAVLEATISALKNPTTTTAVIPKVDGPQGIQTNT